MGDNVEEGYNPPPEFKEDSKEPLLDLTPSDSTEFWLIQWPKYHNPDFDGQQLTLKLNRDGNIGSFKDSSGKEYSLVSEVYEQPNASVFVSSASATKIVGNISRRVSFVHYSEPEELEQQHHSSNLKKLYQQSSTVALTNSTHKSGTPQSSRPRNSRSTSRYPTPTHSSRHKSSLSEDGEQQEASNREKVAEPRSPVDQSTEISGQGRSGVASGSSVERSSQVKSKKRKKSGE